MVTRLQRCAFAFGLAALSACGGSSGGEGVLTTPDRAPAVTALPADAVTYFPETTWRTASPDQVGIPGSILARVDQRVATGAWRGLNSFLVVRRGYLVLKQGQWNGREIVSREWIARSTAPITMRASQFGGVPVDYGLLWWLAAINPAISTADPNNRVIIGAGNLNQFLFVVPSLDLIVVNTGATNDSFGVTVDFVVRELIPAVSR